MRARRFILGVLVFLGLAVMSYTNAFALGALTFFAVLSGGNEVSGTTANAGDTDGFGSATVIIDGTDGLCFAIIVNNIDTPTAAHIHQGKPGQSGSVKVTLTAPDSGNPGASSGCLTGVDSTVLSSIKANPAKFYINVHTESFSAGALRGNLF